jgi:hypothetical protein
LLRRARHAATRTLTALLAAGALVLAYGVAVVWLATGTIATPLLWLLIVPLAILVALLGGALVLVWELAPAITVVRAVRYLAARAADLPRRVPRTSRATLAEEPRPSPPPLAAAPESAAALYETIIIDAPAPRGLPRLPDAA